jgi:hypothetical protein
MNIHQNSFKIKKTHCHRREMIDGIQTHCGFVAVDNAGRGGGGIMLYEIERKCDAFFAARNMAWSTGMQDYVTRQ